MNKKLVIGALASTLFLSSQECSTNSFEREVSPARIESKFEKKESSANVGREKSIDIFEKLSKNFQNSLRRTLKDEQNRDYPKSSIEKKMATENNFNLTRDYVSNSMKVYVTHVTKESKEFSRNVKQYGLDEVLRAYTESQICCLRLARGILKHGRETPNDKECESVGRYIRKLQRKFSGSYIDYDTGKVVKSHEEYAGILTEHFVRILKAGECKEVSKLVRKAYSKEEYLEYGGKQKKANKELYESVRSSARWFVSLFFRQRLNEEIDSLIRNSEERYEASVRDFYGK